MNWPDAPRHCWSGMLAIACLIPLSWSNAAARTDSGECALEVRVVQNDGTFAPAGFDVELTSSEGRRSAQTDGRGSPLRFTDLPCGTVTAGAYSNGFPWHEQLETAELRPSVLPLITLTLPALGRIEVNAVDESGAPVPGGTIRIVAVDDPPVPYEAFALLRGRAATAFLTHHGRYRIDYTPQDRLRSVRVNGAIVQVPFIVEVGADLVRVDLGVAPSRLVRGLVVDRQGRGVPHVSVRALRPGAQEESPALDSMLSEGDGRFVLAVDALPVEVVVLKENSSFHPTSFLVTDQAPELRFVRTEEANGAVMFEGRVIEQGTGRGVAGAHIMLLSACAGPEPPAEERRQQVLRWSSRSDAEGRFSSPCPKDCPFLVRVFDDGLRFVPEDVELPAGRCGRGQVVELSAGGVVTIRVTDEDGRPVVNLPIDGLAANLRTDADGTCRRQGLRPGAYSIGVNRFLLEPARQDIVLTHEPARQGQPVARVDGPGSEVHLDLVTLTGGSICLHAVGPDGSAFPEFALEVFVAEDHTRANLPYSAGAIDRRSGVRCSAPLAPGNYLVLLRGRQFPDTWWPGTTEIELARPVRTEAGARIDLGLMTIPRANLKRRSAALEE